MADRALSAGRRPSSLVFRYSARSMKWAKYRPDFFFKLLLLYRNAENHVMNNNQYFCLLKHQIIR